MRSSAHVLILNVIQIRPRDIAGRVIWEAEGLCELGTVV